MNFRLLIFMAVCLAIVLPIVGHMIHIIDRKDKIKENTGTDLFLKKSRRDITVKLYEFLYQFFLTSGYIDKISRRYEVLYPGENKTIIKKTVSTAITSFTLSILVLLLIWINEPNLNNSVLAIIFLFVINNEVINYLVNSAEIKLLEDMGIFISEVRHNYHINRMVDDAILLSLDGLGNEMKLHAKKIYEITISNNIKEEIIKYNSMMHNKYLKMFLSLSISVIEFSDKKINGQLLFTTNLQHLKREISIELLKLKKLKHVFSGTVFVTMAVCLPVNAIQKFGMSIVPELESFYYGKAGILFVGSIFLTSVIVYLLINNLKEIRGMVPNHYFYLQKVEKIRIIKKALDNYSDKNNIRMKMMKDTLKRTGYSISPRQLLLKRMLLAMITFFVCFSLVYYIHYNNRYMAANKLMNTGSLSSAGKQQKLAEETVLSYVNRFKNEEVVEETILEQLEKEKVFYNPKVNEIIAKEVTTRITRYQNEVLQWYELTACFLAAFITFFVPFWMVLYKKRILKMAMEDEVNQFNSIINMMMYIDHVSVKDLLEQMELFAVAFKNSIQECINNYNCGEMEALIKLKEVEGFGPFRRLIDNLIRCDMIPIDKAFDDIASDKENYHERRKQENEISIQRRVDIAKPLSFIPAVLVTIYLLLPLFYASLKELESFRENLASLGF